VCLNTLELSEFDDLFDSRFAVTGAASAEQWQHLAASVAVWILLPAGLGLLRLHNREIS
jgi:hypothetical protein